MVKIIFIAVFLFFSHKGVFCAANMHAAELVVRTSTDYNALRLVIQETTAVLLYAKLLKVYPALLLYAWPVLDYGLDYLSGARIVPLVPDKIACWNHIAYYCPEYIYPTAVVLTTAFTAYAIFSIYAAPAGVYCVANVVIAAGLCLADIFTEYIISMSVGTQTTDPASLDLHPMAQQAIAKAQAAHALAASPQATDLLLAISTTPPIC